MKVLAGFLKGADLIQTGSAARFQSCDSEDWEAVF